MDSLILAIIGIVISAIVCRVAVYPCYAWKNSVEPFYAFLTHYKIIDYATYDHYYSAASAQAKKKRTIVVVASLCTIVIGIVLNGVLAAGYLGGLLISTGIADWKSRNNVHDLSDAFCELNRSATIDWCLLEEEYENHKFHPLCGEPFNTFCDWYGHSEERRLYLLRTRAELNN